METPAHLGTMALPDLMGDWREREAGRSEGISNFPQSWGFMSFVNRYSTTAQNMVILAACGRGTIGSKWLTVSPEPCPSKLPGHKAGLASFQRITGESAQTLSCVTQGCSSPPLGLQGDMPCLPIKVDLRSGGKHTAEISKQGLRSHASLHPPHRQITTLDHNTPLRV